MVNTGSNEKPDFAHVAKLDFWTLDEAIAYSLGEDPSVVNFAEMQPHEHSRLRSDRPRPSKYWKRAELVERNADQLAERLKGITAFSGGAWYQRKTSPDIFIPWALDNFDSVHVELVAAWKARLAVITKKRDLAELDAIGAQVVEQHHGSDPEKAPTEGNQQSVAVAWPLPNRNDQPMPSKPRRENRDAMRFVIDKVVDEQGGDDALYAVLAGLARHSDQPGSCIKDVNVKEGVVIWQRPGGGAETLNLHALKGRLKRRKARPSR